MYFYRELFKIKVLHICHFNFYFEKGPNNKFLKLKKFDQRLKIKFFSFVNRLKAFNNTYSETLELFSPTEPNRIKHVFAGSELFQYFDVFSSPVRSNRTLF